MGNIDLLLNEGEPQPAESTTHHRTLPANLLWLDSNPVDVAPALVYTARKIMARIVGLDVGDKRIGVAVSDPTGLLVTPLLTVQRKNMSADVARLAALVAEQEAGMVVVGLPLNMDGTEGEQALKVRSLAKQLSLATNVPIEFQDERLSTFSAIEALTERGVKTGHNRELVDMEAAAIILRAYLDR